VIYYLTFISPARREHLSILIFSPFLLRALDIQVEIRFTAIFLDFSSIPFLFLLSDIPPLFKLIGFLEHCKRKTLALRAFALFPISIMCGRDKKEHSIYAVDRPRIKLLLRWNWPKLLLGTHFLALFSSVMETGAFIRAN